VKDAFRGAMEVARHRKRSGNPHLVSFGLRVPLEVERLREKEKKEKRETLFSRKYIQDYYPDVSANPQETCVRTCI